MTELRTDFDRRTIFLYGDIGQNEINAGAIIGSLDELGSGPVTVRLNSTGGCVAEGWSIHAALNRHPGAITCVNDGVVASMASLVYLAGETRLTTQNASFMIHSPSTLAKGNERDLRKVADRLSFFEAEMIRAYGEVLNVDESELQEWIREETWFDAKQAIAIGLATGIVEGTLSATPKLPSSSYRNDLAGQKVFAKVRAFQSRQVALAMQHSRQFSPGMLARFGYRPGLRNAQPAKSGQGDNGTLNKPNIHPKHSAWLKAYNAPRQKQAAKIAAWAAEREVAKVATQIIHADKLFNLKYQRN